ncbi:hypothetical protein VTK73DRAFT_5789 [Phialemonium thermophilum]|uniref:PIPK domain-containing protein n=1 Tax=Phialemonium thermophilum TaxID=223376 RepID=A0ABR3WM64_9PEZI
MGRDASIARSIVIAITAGARKRGNSLIATILNLFSVFFSLYQIHLRKISPAKFATLRRDRWNLADDSYVSSFRPSEGDQEPGLKPIGDMGFSGSTFYSTADRRFIIKSLPRHSEHSFFRDDMLSAYVQHMISYPKSLLVHIYDFLGSPSLSLGRILRLVPSHHIVMENILYGKEEGKARGEVWEDWDLKPTSYFYPERDIADGRLASDATKDRLADEFHDKIILTREQADELLAILERDTELLAKYKAVDYSLFLVRITTTNQRPRRSVDHGSLSADSGTAPSWRTGIASPDGQHVFRAVILDFFWAKHKIQPKLMTFLVNLWNLLVSNKGPMSITTTPDEYRNRFLPDSSWQTWNKAVHASSSPSQSRQAQPK